MDAPAFSERARVMYDRMYAHVQTSKRYVSRPAKTVESPEWVYETSASIDAVAGQSGSRLYRNYSTIPNVHLIGYNHDSIDKTVSFLETLALQGTFEECAFLAEGFDEQAKQGKLAPLTNSQLRGLFKKYRLSPKGRDSSQLRERQYAFLDQINTAKSEEERRAKVHLAMECLIRRERDYFVPAVLEEQDRPIIFLTDMIHVLSFSLPQMLNNKNMKPAIFVPQYQRK